MVSVLGGKLTKTTSPTLSHGCRTFLSNLPPVHDVGIVKEGILLKNLLTAARYGRASKDVDRGFGLNIN